MLSITRPRRILLGSSGILTVSATEIWEWELSCEVVSAPARTQTGTGYNLHQGLTASSQWPATEAGTGKPYFQKAFFHNGYIKSLKQLVHFYNTRDTSYAYPVTSGHFPAGTIR